MVFIPFSIGGYFNYADFALDMHNTKPSTDDLSLFKYSFNLVRCGTRHDIKVFGFYVKEEIANATSNKFCIEPIVTEFLHNTSNRFGYLRRIDKVFVSFKFRQGVGLPRRGKE